MATPLVPSDLLQFALVSDPQIAPDGAAVYYRRAWFDRDADEVRGAIRRVERDGADRAFTSGTNDRLPRVAPDGSALAFVGDRDGKTRLFVLRLDGGEAVQLGTEYPKIVALAWSPDAKRIAFVATAAHDARTARAFHDEKTGARHIRMLPFKSDADGLLDGTRKHLFVIDADGGGAARQITSGDFDVSPPSWSPDGTKIAFSSRLDLPPAVTETSTSLSDVFVVDVASGAHTKLTSSDGPMQPPAFSHDGKEIAFAGHRHGDDGGGRFDYELLVVPAEGGEIRSLSAGLGRTVSDTIAGDLRSGVPLPPVWSADDREILALVSDEGSAQIRAFARDGGGTRIVAGGERQIFAYSTSNDGAIAFAYGTPTVPNEIALLEPYGGERKLTDANPWLAEKSVVAPKRYRPRADDGTVLDAWLIAPAQTSEAKPPLVLQVHGGPHAAYGQAFFFEFQVLAAQGIAVAYGNPRGSQSYGHDYANAILGQWGGIDAADVLRILDGALEQGSFDTARIGVAGGSYGGFMTTWLLGHSDRFAAGVSMRAVNDFVSEVGATDIGWFLERELEAPYAADAGRKLFEGSPMRAASSIDAPLLVEHSERDYRCAIDQGEQLFTILRRLGKTDTEFVRFAQTGHELSRAGKPRSRIFRLRAIAHWFIRHLKPAGIEPAPNEAGALFGPLPGESADALP
ncbi:MAG TPA: S9 family peptidase [Candidatus Elarobacter sp.]|jgi:dipeptidyl aminopeptidase/acylaminoacyl peptidase|nr:S9 family peptidase [Candidatus Elarobacter sp.]